MRHCVTLRSVTLICRMADEREGGAESPKREGVDDFKIEEEEDQSNKRKPILSNLKSELGEAWQPAALPEDLLDSASDSSRRSKRIRRKKTTFSFTVPKPSVKKVKRIPSGSSVETSHSSIIHGGAELQPWGIRPKDPDQNSVWSEVKGAEVSILAQDGDLISRVVKAVASYLSKNPHEVKISWESVAKEAKKGRRTGMNGALCQAVWRLCAYKLSKNGTVVDQSLLEKRTLSVKEVEEGESDLEDNYKHRKALGVKGKEKREGDVEEEALSHYFPRAPYSRFSSEEAWDGTGLPRVVVDVQGLPTYSWKNEDDLNIVNAVIKKRSHDWTKIKEEVTNSSLKCLQAIVLKRRFIQLEKSVRENRYKYKAVVERMQLLTKTFPDLLARILR